MDYSKLDPGQFDAIVTGDLAHYDISLESGLCSIICDHFAPGHRSADFRRLILDREGLTFQHKIDIVKAMLPFFPNQVAAHKLKGHLKKIEEYKDLRNALAHGKAVTPPDAPSDSNSLEFSVETVSRSGKRKETIAITPKSRRALLWEMYAVILDLEKIRNEIQRPTHRA